MLTGAFDYPLPEELIAQHPTPERTGSRLLVLDRETHRLAHHSFPDLGHFLHPGDLLVLNDSRVIPARLRAKKTDTGGAIELLLLEENSPMDWWVLLRPGKRVRPGTRLAILAPDGSATDLAAVVLEKNEEGRCRLRFSGTDRFHDAVERWGEIPLPPYMHRDNAESRLDDRERYQTVFARQKGVGCRTHRGTPFHPRLSPIPCRAWNRPLLRHPARRLRDIRARKDREHR